MKWLIKLLAREIAIAIRQYDEQTEWINHHKAEIHRERAVARIEAPNKADDFDYIKQQVLAKLQTY